jgi:hypothetical protein
MINQVIGIARNERHTLHLVLFFETQGLTRCEYLQFSVAHPFVVSLLDQLIHRSSRNTVVGEVHIQEHAQVDTALELACLQ